MSFEIKEDTFASPNFNEKQWLSRVLSAHSSETEQLKLLSVIDSKLQLVHHNCIHSLALNQKVLASKLEDSVPATAQAQIAIEKLAQSHSGYKGKNENEKFGKEFEEMWIIKGRLEESLKSLNSIESFEVKATEIENILLKGRIDDLLQRIEEMKACFSVMKSLSSHLSLQRRSFDTLKGKLTNFATPLLDRAIQESDITMLANLSKILEIADQSSVLVEKYAKFEESIFLKQFSDMLVLSEHSPSSQSIAKDPWISTFISTLGEYLTSRNQKIQDVVPSSANQLKFYRSLLQIILSKTQDTLLEKIFAEEVSSHPTLYNFCLQNLYDKALRLTGDQVSPEIISILLRPLKEVVNGLQERYISIIAGELKKVCISKYDDYELKEARKSVSSAIEKIKSIYVSYKAIAIQHQLPNFISSLKKIIEEFLQGIIGELLKQAVELHGGVAIALIDGQTDKEPQQGYGNLDWKKIQIAVIQFDIIQDLLNFLDNLQNYINADAPLVNKQQECQLLTYSHYVNYLEKVHGIILYKKDQSIPAFKFLEEIKNNLALTAKNIVIKCFYGPIFKHVAFIQTNKIWTAVDDDDPDLPQFSLTPSESITATGEQLMACMHRLESLNTLIINCPEKIKRYSLLYQAEVINKGEAKEIDAGVYWVLLFGVSICKILSGKYMQIHALSTKGSKQLAADICYILNILRIINVDASLRAGLESILVALKMDPRGSENLMEKANKTLDLDEDLKNISKELLDCGIIKNMIIKRMAGNKSQ